MSAIVVEARTLRPASAASAKTPVASRPKGPSRSSTISRTVISEGSRAKPYPPLTPRWERRMPARRSTAKSCSRNWTGISRRRASSPIGTGPAPPQRPSSVRAWRAYGLFVVIEITKSRLVAHSSSGARKPALLGTTIASETDRDRRRRPGHAPGRLHVPAGRGLRGRRRGRRRPGGGAPRPPAGARCRAHGFPHARARRPGRHATDRAQPPGRLRDRVDQRRRPDGRGAIPSCRGDRVRPEGRLRDVARAAEGSAAGLEPAALRGEQDGLGAVDRAELAVDVVQVRA